MVPVKEGLVKAELEKGAPAEGDPAAREKADPVERGPAARGKGVLIFRNNRVTFSMPPR